MHLISSRHSISPVSCTGGTPVLLFRSIARGLLVAGLIMAIGLQWMLVQSAGWASMLVRYSQEGSLMQAVEMTFDGEHPCELCKLAARGVQEDQKKDSAAHELIKLVMDRFDSEEFRLFSTYTSLRFEGVNLRGMIRAAVPLGQPPRG
jgi:hypothetical protein